MSERDRPDEEELRERIRVLEDENARLRSGLFAPSGADTVRVPDAFRPVFDQAEDILKAM